MKKIDPPSLSADDLFYAGTGLLLLKTSDAVHLFDVQQRHVLASYKVSKVCIDFKRVLSHYFMRHHYFILFSQVKYVIWSPNMESVALLSKHYVNIVDRQLKSLASIHESTRVKSVFFATPGVKIFFRRALKSF